MANTPNPTITNRIALSDGIGRLGLYLYAFSAWLSPPLHLIGLLMSGVALMMVPDVVRRIATTRAAKLWLMIAVYLLLQSFWGNHLLPDSLGTQLRETLRWLAFGNFLIIGWWLKGDPRIIRNVLILAVAGLCIGILHSVDWTALVAFQTGKQTGFHLTASTGALLAATVILGLLLNPPEAIHFSRFKWRNTFRLGVWSATIYLMIFLLVASQSRTTWIAAMITIPLVFHLRKRKTPPSRENRHALRPGWIVLLLMLAGVGLNRQVLLDRITPDLALVESLPLNKPVESEVHSSLGYRINVQKFGLEKWREHPLMGWGTASTRQLIASAGRPELWHEPTRGWLSHLHNGYLEILVRFGLLGASIFFLSVLSLLRRFLQDGAWRALHVNNLSWLSGGALLMTVIWTGGVFQMTAPTWQAYWTLLMASGFSASLFPSHPGRTGAPPVVDVLKSAENSDTLNI